MGQEQRETFFYGDGIEFMSTSNSKLRPVRGTLNRTRIITETSEKEMI